ncbi:hypothetical protein OAB09_03340 [Pelagibacteraceae bacterium]|jgi:hypothetical protein|nr:hypothetical protein [Pelagibacteraceae bacterium]
MKKIFSIIFLGFVLTSCAYRPLINPEASNDPATGENIAGNYWKDLHACRYIHEQNTSEVVKKLKISDEVEFVKKCMEDYGYSVLR